MDNEFDIAIVGMSCRLPGASSLEAFWRNLAGGVESIARLSDQEILDSGVPSTHLRDPNYVKAAPILEEPGGFDAAFFGYAPMEARSMDPQQRILLELAHEALEHAGCDPDRYPGRVGVFTGSALNTYFTTAGLNRRLAEEYIPTLIGNDKDFLSTRISYKLNLKGPSLTVQTACSTSLVAIHLARQSLMSQETDVALAGAISVRVPHRAGYFADAGGVVSPDGHVRAFDAKANGTVFGSGGGVLVLKRLADALADGDTIHAVIKGSAVNNDGTEKAGYTAPSVNGQADAVVEALANAGVDADSISYVEAHGSGTPVGDPIEVRALTRAFRTQTQRSGYCAIGSVKTNVGHLDAAAGVAGVIKTVLALKHRKLPPSLNFTQPNPEIDFAASPFYVNAQLRNWASDGPRRAGVMATGMGGTNAHVVLEEAPERASLAGDASPHLLVLSAKTETALDHATRRLRDFLHDDKTATVSDVAYTLQAGRKAYPHRRFVVCADRADAVSALSEERSARLISGLARSDRRSLVLLLPGVGDHYVGMGHDLYGSWPIFQQEVDRCAELLEPSLGADIRKIIYPHGQGWKKQGQPHGIDLKRMLARAPAESEDADTKKLNETIYTQPAQFVIEYALARTWMDLGVTPSAIVGHSMGEYVAACLAGVLSLEDALRLIVRRTQLVDQLPAGRMLAVALPEEELTPLLAPDVSICLINGPSLCVVAGAPKAVEGVEAMLFGKGVMCRPVRNTHAFHSRMLDPIVGAYEEEVRKVRLNEPKIPFVSNVTGTWITKTQATDPAYWASHTNHTARFSDALRTLWQLGEPLLLEAGPGKTLGVLAMQHPDRKNTATATVVSSVRHHYENRNDVELLLESVGRLWVAGVDIRWDTFHQHAPRRKVPLPTYPFERQRHWFDEREPANAPPLLLNELVPEGPAPGIDGWFYTPTWERAVTTMDASRTTLDVQSAWLVIADCEGGGGAFCKTLAQSGADVTFARFGDEFRRNEDGSFDLNRASPVDYQSLFREIRGKHTGSLNVVHLGCLAAGKWPPDGASQERRQGFGFFSLLYTAQAIGALGIESRVRIGILSQGLHEVTGDEALDPTMATALGLAKVIPHEYPNVACFNVDLPEPQRVDDLEEDVVARFLAEFTEWDPGEAVAYRGRHRWVRKYKRVMLPAISRTKGGTPVPSEVPRVSRLRNRGVYLITGGTGGLGLAFAEFLARSCQARIVLTKKTAFPDKSIWGELLESKQAPEAVLEVLRKLRDIEQLGAEVEVFTAEASDADQMRKVVTETRRRFGAIHGVFHAAGIVKPALIRDMNATSIADVLSPKVSGTWVLFDLMQEIGPDFVVLFSSMSSVTAAYAHADYGAANRFLDAFAAYANAHSKFHTLAVNWPVWKEVGIGAGSAYFAQLQALLGVEDLQQEMLRRAILTVDGVEAFARALSSDLPQIVVSPENLDHLLERSRQAARTSRPRPGAPATDNVDVTDGVQGSAADQPTNDIETEVARIWGEVFGHTAIGVHQTFAALGGHSLIAMQIVARVRSFYQVALSLREFFSAPTIAALSATIKQKIVSEIDALSDDEAQRLAHSLRTEKTS